MQNKSKPNWDAKLFFGLYKLVRNRLVHQSSLKERYNLMPIDVQFDDLSTKIIDHSMYQQLISNEHFRSMQQSLNHAITTALWSKKIPKKCHWMPDPLIGHQFLSAICCAGATASMPSRNARPNHPKRRSEIKKQLIQKATSLLNQLDREGHRVLDDVFLQQQTQQIASLQERLESKARNYENKTAIVRSCLESLSFALLSYSIPYSTVVKIVQSFAEMLMLDVSNRTVSRYVKNGEEKRSNLGTQSK